MTDCDWVVIPRTGKEYVTRIKNRKITDTEYVKRKLIFRRFKQQSFNLKIGNL